MKSINDYDIDFVILWVDGSDSEWQRQKCLYASTGKISENDNDSNSDNRYRGNDQMLRFWFRGVEKYASWVHNIFFITAGQVPSWLNDNHPKLVIVNHEDFIPKQYLPTFNSLTIQFNLHRISSLSEHFVLFDDDMFLMRDSSPDDYFMEGNPVLGTYLGFINIGYSNWHRLMLNSTAVINKQFNVPKAIWKYRHKWFNFSRLGFSFASYNLMCFLVNKIMPVHFYGHMPYPHLKTAFYEAWAAQYEVLHKTCMHKFRSDDQVIHYLLCAWNQLTGRFHPAPIDPLGKWYSLSPDNLEIICEAIRKKSYPVICINDSSNNTKPDIASKHIEAAFSIIFPEKSEFEK